MKCLICDYESKNLQGLSCHISKQHKNITIQNYYDKYVGIAGVCNVCKKPTKFLNLIKGYSKYCSMSCLNKSPEHIQSVIEGNLKKYGVKNVFQLEEIKQKSRETLIKKTGFDHSSKNPETVNKRKLVWLNKYGVDHPWKVSEIFQKKNSTMIERYGTTVALQNNEIKEKQQNTVMKKYGVTNVSKIKEIKKRISESNKKIFWEKLITSDRLLGLCSPNFDITDFNSVSDTYSWTCAKCGKEFLDHLDNGRIPRCYHCYPIPKSSKYETEIYDFCKQFFNKVYTNVRYILKDREIDIYIPEIKLAIEFNGLYWHSERQGKSSDYHESKYLRLQELGIDLISIFEDEWIEKQRIIKSIILSKMKKISKKIFARKCDVKVIENNEAYRFYIDNHLQGSIKGKHYGLVYNNDVVSLLTVGKPRFSKKHEWEIYRFCSKIDISVVGGLSKLFSEFIKDKNPKSIVTYSDLRFGNGNGYKIIGFNFVGKTNPNYFYLDSRYLNRKSRLFFQKHKLNDILPIFDPNLTEWENMQLNNYDRIWDCGNNVYMWTNG